jgi:hypothetical protein
VRSRFNKDAKTAAKGCLSPKIVVRKHPVGMCAVHQLEMEKKEERSKSRGVRVAAQMKKKGNAEMKGKKREGGAEKKDAEKKGKKRESGAEKKDAEKKGKKRESGAEKKDAEKKGKKRESGAEKKNGKKEADKGKKKSVSTSKSNVICGDCEHKQRLQDGG